MVRFFLRNIQGSCCWWQWEWGWLIIIRTEIISKYDDHPQLEHATNVLVENGIDITPLEDTVQNEDCVYEWTIFEVCFQQISRMRTVCNVWVKTEWSRGGSLDLSWSDWHMNVFWLRILGINRFYLKKMDIFITVFEFVSHFNIYICRTHTYK